MRYTRERVPPAGTPRAELYTAVAACLRRRLGAAPLLHTKSVFIARTVCSIVARRAEFPATLPTCDTAVAPLPHDEVVQSIAGPLGVFALAIGFIAAGAQNTRTHPFAVPQSGADPDAVLAVIEIPAGSFTKYEIDRTTGHLVVDRFQPMPVAYPANYGAIPSSLAGDGDPLDVLVLTREPVVPGAFIRVRPIGVLRMIDGGAEDDKVIAVPISDVDPQYDAVRTIADLPEIERQRIEAFFRVYKDLPAGRPRVELRGFAGAAEAKASVRAAIDAYQRR